MNEIEIEFYRTLTKHLDGFNSTMHSWSDNIDRSVVKPTQDFWHGDKNYKGSGWAHGLRQRIGRKVHPSNTASNVAEVGLLSQLQFSEVEIVGQALEKIKKDPEVIRYDNEFAIMAKKILLMAKKYLVLIKLNR